MWANTHAYKVFFLMLLKFLTLKIDTLIECFEMLIYLKIQIKMLISDEIVRTRKGKMKWKSPVSHSCPMISIL